MFERSAYRISVEPSFLEKANKFRCLDTTRKRDGVMLAWLWGVLLVGATVFVSIVGTLLVRRWIPVEVLERHNEVAGFIYAVIGVVYAVLLGFTAIIVWEWYDKAQAALDAETNDLIDLYRDAETFPNDIRGELDTQLRTYARLVADKEWPAMAEHKSSPEVWDAYTQLWRTYYRFRPENDNQRIWYTASITRLNDLGAPGGNPKPLTARRWDTRVRKHDDHVRRSIVPLFRSH
jgi:hypothetical protein